MDEWAGNERRDAAEESESRKQLEEVMQRRERLRSIKETAEAAREQMKSDPEPCPDVSPAGASTSSDLQQVDDDMAKMREDFNAVEQEFFAREMRLYDLQWDRILWRGRAVVEQCVFAIEMLDREELEAAHELNVAFGFGILRDSMRLLVAQLSEL